MKYKIYVLFLLFALASCNTQAVVATPTSTHLPTETPAPPTQTSTPTETPTPTATAAPDIGSTEAGQATMKLFTDAGINSDLVEFKMDEDSVVCIDKVTQKEACRDGRFDLHWLVPNLPAENLEKTVIEPLNMPQRVDPPRSITLGDHAKKVIQEVKVSGVFPDLKYILPGLLLRDFTTQGETRYAWGNVLIDNLGRVGPYLAYFDVDGVLQLVPIEPITPDDIMNDFWSNPDLYVRP